MFAGDSVGLHYKEKPEKQAERIRIKRREMRAATTGFLNERSVMDTMSVFSMSTFLQSIINSTIKTLSHNESQGVTRSSTSPDS